MRGRAALSTITDPQLPIMTTPPALSAQTASMIAYAVGGVRLGWGLVCGVVGAWIAFRGCCWVRWGTLGRRVVLGGFRGVRWVRMAAVWVRSASDTVECNCSR